MTEKIYQKGLRLESNTCYKARELQYDFYPEDCVCTDQEVYFSYTKNSGLSMPVGFLLVGLENVVLDFQGATLMFHGRITPFVLDRCKNVRVINFKVDYDRPFYTQAHVLECDTKRMKIRIDDGFRYRVEDGFFYAVSDTWEKNLNTNDCLLWLYDRTGEKNYPIILSLFGPEIFPGENPALPIRQILVEEDGEDLILHGDFPPQWETNNGNNSLVFTHEIRDKSAMILLNSQDITIEHFLLIHSASIAMVCMNVENLYLDDVSMYMDYQGNGRLVTSNADGVHMFNCKGNFVLKNSHMEGLLDDTVNVHCNYLNVVRAEGDTLVCRFIGAGLKLSCPLFVEGDQIAVYRGRTQEEKSRYTIKSVTLDPENEQYRYRLDRPAEDIDENDIIENLSGQPEILIENCYFGRFRGTMRLQSREKTVVRNCTFDNKEWSIIFTGDTTFWFESGPVQDFLLENCCFSYTKHTPRLHFFGEVEFTEKEPYYHRNITVRGCEFAPGEVAVLHHVDNFVFENNHSEGEMIIRAENCGRIRCDDNVKLIGPR